MDSSFSILAANTYWVKQKLLDIKISEIINSILMNNFQSLPF